MGLFGWDWTVIWTAGAALGNFTLAGFALSSLKASRQAIAAGEAQLVLARRQTEIAEQAASKAREDALANTRPQVFILPTRTEMDSTVSLLNAGGGYLMLSEIRYLNSGFGESHNPALDRQLDIGTLDLVAPNRQTELMIKPEQEATIIRFTAHTRGNIADLNFLRMRALMRYSRDPARLYELNVVFHLYSLSMPVGTTTHVTEIQPPSAP